MPLPSLFDATLEQLRDGLANGDFTSVQLTKAYIARIQEVNEAVHAVTEVNPDALTIAEGLDRERKGGKLRGNLHGIPVLVKNNIGTKDKMNTTAGSSLLIGATVARDAHVVHQLRQSGAVVLGKTNMSQWANYRSQGTPLTGWTVDGGQTLAAYCEAQSPSGSSSGSGVAVDLGLAWAALGTETDGSIVSPAGRNCIVGVKPTVGLTSRDMAIPVSERQDTIGPMARTVRDAAYLLQAIAGKDPHDPYTDAIPDGDIPDYVSACDEDALRGARIGVPWGTIEQALAKEDAKDLRVEVEAFKKALSTLEGLGAAVIETKFDSTLDQISADEGLVMRADFPVNLAAYLAQLTSNPSGIGSLADVRDKTQANPVEEYPTRNTKVWDEVLAQGWDNTSPEFDPVHRRLLERAGPGGLPGALDRDDLVAVVMPTTISFSWAAVPGLPAVSVPLGHYPDGSPVHREDTGSGLVVSGPGVPFGLCFLGRRWAERELIGLASGFERGWGVRAGAVGRVVKAKTEIGDVL